MILVLHDQNTGLVDESPGQATEIDQVGDRITAVIPRRRDGGMTEAYKMPGRRIDDCITVKAPENERKSQRCRGGSKDRQGSRSVPVVAW